jgi:hypothetical protein
MVRSTRLAFLTLALLGLVLGSALLSGCSQKSAAPSTAAPASAVAPPTIKVVAPTEGATLPAGDIKVSVQTTGLKFVMPGGADVAGEGHVHFTLDSLPLKMSDKPDYTFTGVAAGAHTLHAELVQNDAKSFTPPVEQVVKFTIK